MNDKLISIASSLDEKGFPREADFLDSVIMSIPVDSSGEIMTRTIDEKTARSMADALEEEREGLTALADELEALVGAINIESLTMIKNFLESNDLTQGSAEPTNPQVVILSEAVNDVSERLRDIRSTVNITDLYDEAIMILNHIGSGTGD